MFGENSFSSKQVFVSKGLNSKWSKR